MLKLMYTLSFNRTCKQLGSTGLACTKSSSLYRFCLCLLTAQFWTYEEYEHVINWSGLRFEHGNLQYGSLYDCGEIRAKLAMHSYGVNSLNSTSILHAVRVLLAFAANVYEQCVTEEISIHRNVETKSDKMLHESPSKTLYHVHSTARMPNRLLHFPLYNWWQ